MTLESFENFSCPYCGSDNELLIDPSVRGTQEFVVDCETCCAPIVVRFKLRGADIVFIDARRENE